MMVFCLAECFEILNSRYHTIEETSFVMLKGYGSKA